MTISDFDRLHGDAPCRPSRLRGSGLIVGLALLAWAGLLSFGVAGVWMAEDLLQHL